MPENVIATFTQMFNNLKNDMDKNFDELKKSIESYQNKTNDQSVTIAGIIRDVDNLGDRLRDNFEQHKQYYDKFDIVETKLAIIDGKNSTIPLITSVVSILIALAVLALKLVG